MTEVDTLAVDAAPLELSRAKFGRAAFTTAAQREAELV